MTLLDVDGTCDLLVISISGNFKIYNLQIDGIQLDASSYELHSNIILNTKYDKMAMYVNN